MMRSDGDGCDDTRPTDEQAAEAGPRGEHAGQPRHALPRHCYRVRPSARRRRHAQRPGFFASTDGGHAWHTSPATGIPASDTAPFATMTAYATGLIVPFSDGSNTSAPLFTWSSASQRWNLVATAPVNNVLYILP